MLYPSVEEEEEEEEGMSEIKGSSWRMFSFFFFPKVWERVVPEGVRGVDRR